MKGESSKATMRVREAAAAKLREFRAVHRLDGVTIGELIDEDRDRRLSDVLKHLERRAPRPDR